MAGHNISVKWLDKLVEAKPDGDERYFWDKKQPGFGVRQSPKGQCFFLVQYRVKDSGKQRRVALGQYGTLTLDEARDRARRFVSAGKDGRDLQAERDAKAADDAQRLTLDQVAAKWIELHVKPKRSARTLYDYEKVLRAYLKPTFGKKLVADITRADVLTLHQQMKDTPKVADYAVIVGKAVVNFGTKNGFLPATLLNPFKGIELYGSEGRERFLSAAEVVRIGEALTELEAAGKVTAWAGAAIRLYIFTGTRKSEILTLQWPHVDLDQAALLLPQSKTGKRRIELNAAAIAVLKNLLRVKGNPHVIVGQKNGQHMKSLHVPWGKVCKKAEITGCRIHDLRHTFASFAASDGVSLLMIGKLLGHTVPRTTQRYAHLTEDALRRANSELGDKLAGLMGSTLGTGTSK